MSQTEACPRCGMVLGLCVCHVPTASPGDIALNEALEEFVRRAGVLGVKIERAILHPFGQQVLVLRGVGWDSAQACWVLEPERHGNIRGIFPERGLE